MGIRYTRIAAALFVSTLITGALGQKEATVQPETYKVEVRVVNAQGKPVAGQTVATWWEKSGNTMKPAQWGYKAVTDKNGKASLILKQRYASLMAYDKAMKSGAQVAVDASKTKVVKLQLGPLATLKAKVEVEQGETKLDPPFWSLMTWGDGFGTSAMHGPSEAQTQLRLPPGKYQFSVFSLDTTGFFKSVDLKPGQVMDLGRVSLKLTALAKSYGKEAPAMKVTEARGLDKPFNLADYKGKWVALEFWGFW